MKPNTCYLLFGFQNNLVIFSEFRHFFWGDNPRKRLREAGYLSLDGLTPNFI